jgi:Spy/CpxP family protein refolding chaperone
MSTIRTLALGALMVVGVAGVSAAQSTAAPRTRADSGQFRARRGPGGEGRGFGRDLNLTEAQKTQIKAIRQKYQPQQQALRAQAKPYMDAAKAARQKGDTAAARTNFEKARQVEQGASFRTQEQAEIRAILTPEQQAKFDAHQKEAANRRAQGGKKGWGHKRAGAAPAAKS